MSGSPDKKVVTINWSETPQCQTGFMQYFHMKESPKKSILIKGTCIYYHTKKKNKKYFQSLEKKK